MSDPRTFTTSDSGHAWAEQGHNGRTWEAWSTGVRRAALYQTPGVYAESNSDYWRAELAGYKHCRGRLNRGERWQCECCGAHHGKDVFDVRKH